MERNITDPMHLCVFEDDQAAHFLPVVHTRAVYDLRLGIRTLLQTIRESFGDPGTILHARGYVAPVTAEENELLVNRIPEGLDVLFVNGRWVVEEGDVLDRIRDATKDRSARVFLLGDEVLAAWVPGASSRFVEADAITASTFDGMPTEKVDGARMVSRIWDLFSGLDDALRRDYAVRMKGHYVYERPGVRICDGAILSEGEQIYIGPGSVVRPGAILNAEYGPIYIGGDVEIEEHAVVKGPAYIGPKSVIRTNADIRNCAFGFWSKVGGQVDGAIIQSLSNKAHDGYLGESYIGRWCNIGADTNTSNLRNDYAEVVMYDAVAGDFVPTGQQFLGMVMADHSKCAINTAFNTGSVIGVSCNLYGAGLMPRHVPSFSWGGPEDFKEFRLDKALKVAEAVLLRRDHRLTDAERQNLAAVFEMTRGEQVVK